MSCSIKNSSNQLTLANLSTLSAIATFIANRIHPLGGAIGSQLSVPAAMAQVMNDMSTGQITNPQLGPWHIPMSYNTLVLAQRTMGLLAAGGLLAGAATAGVTCPRL